MCAGPRSGDATTTQSVPVPVAGRPVRVLRIPASRTAAVRASIAIAKASTVADGDSAWLITNARLMVPGRIIAAVPGSPPRNALEHPAVHHAPTIRRSWDTVVWLTLWIYTPVIIATAVRGFIASPRTRAWR